MNASVCSIWNKKIVYILQICILGHIIIVLWLWFLIWITLGRVIHCCSAEFGFCGVIMIVVACEDVLILLMLLTSELQACWSSSVLVPYLSSVNRGADNCERCELESCKNG